MQVEEWEEIKRIFESALKFTNAERAGYLDAACRQNSALRETVVELLRAHDEASGFLEEEADSALPTVFTAGQLVAGRFRIVRLLSRGGMGEVYETYDERLSVRLALKTLRPEYASDQDALERFRREIRVTRDFGHPNLCRVYELVEHRLPPDEAHAGERIITCLTMQLMSGETLQTYLKKHGPLAPQTALPLIRQITSAVGALHRNGIIHRDLKPSNIMIAAESGIEVRAIVMDFGLSKPFRTDGDVFESRSDFRAGAPFYLAPELVRGEKPGVASDVYALGLIIDEMVTGGGAFSGSSVEEILYQKLWTEPKDASTRKPGLPLAWCQVIRRCLQRDPGKRFTSADVIPRELTVDLPDRRTQPLPLLYHAHGGWHPIEAVRRRFPSWRISRGASASLAALVAAGAALGYIGSRPVNTSVLMYDFDNLTGDAKNDYLSKGTTWEVERLLSELPGVTVNSFHGPHPKTDLARPNTRFAIDGNLQADSSMKRLAVRVTENSTGRIVWMHNYDTSAVSCLKMQSDIAAGAVDAMRDAVLEPKTNNNFGFLERPGAALVWLHRLPFLSGPRPGAQPTQNQQAMEAYTRGRTLWEERTLASERAAAKEYEKALQYDPNFALAEADLAGVYLGLLQLNAAQRKPLLEGARQHAESAVSKGPQLATAYTSLAAVQQASWEWRQSGESYRKAIALDPKNARAHRWYGGFLIQFSRFDEGLRETRTAIKLDPYDYSGHFSLGLYLMYAGKLHEEVDVITRALQSRDLELGHQNLAYAYAQLALRATGSERRTWLNKALGEAEIVTKLEGAEPAMSAPLFALIYGLRREPRRADVYLRQLIEAEQAGSLDPMDLAYAYLGQDNNRSAMALVTKAVRLKDPSILYLKVDPFLNPLRSDPAFQKLIAQTGL